MKSAVVSVLLCSTFISLATSKSLGWIVNGNEATIEDHPYQVSLEIFIKGDSQSYLCGGSIISANFVLTAAHCYGPTVYIYYGSKYVHDRHHRRKVSQWISHEEYDPKTLENDIALAGFKKAIRFTSKVSIVKLPRYTNLEDGTLLTVTGWGDTEDGTGSKVLMEVDVPVFNFEECQNIYADSLESTICLGGDEEDACRGDSGGPAVKDGFQYGIVSSGKKDCGKPSIPGLYTKVSDFYDWIMENIELNHVEP